MRLIYNIIFSSILSIILISIDLITNLFYENYYTFTNSIGVKEIGVTIIISLSISYLSNRLRVLFSAVLILFSLLEIGFFIFFRSYIKYYHYQLIFSEFDDIIDSISCISHIIYIILITFMVLIFFFKLVLSKIEPISSNFIRNILFVLIFLMPIFALHRANLFLTNSINFSYLNTLYSLSLSVGKLFENSSNRFKEYIVEKIDTKKQNVIWIIGESLSYKRMSLYGYDLNNTPNLNSLKGNPNFAYFRAISCGVNSIFFNRKS